MMNRGLAAGQAGILLGASLIRRRWVRGNNDGGRAMAGRFEPVTDVAGLEPLFARSDGEPVLLFKHDPGCSISEYAYREMLHAAPDSPLIDVARAKDVAREVAQRTGVRHESPQVILLRGGQAAWSASHFSITAEAVEEALEKHG